MLHGTLAKLAGIVRFQPRLAILMYHRVLSQFDPFLKGDVTKEVFNWQVQILAKHFNVETLDNALKQLNDGTLKQGTVCITFDDGYADNHSLALPILKKHKVPATFFISTGHLNGGIMWNDVVIESIRGIEQTEVDLRPIGLSTFSTSNDKEKVDSVKKIVAGLKYLGMDERFDKVMELNRISNVKLPDAIMMTDDEVLDLDAQGMEIGAHTLSHPILERLPLVDAEKEIRGSKEYLEQLLEKKVTTFAYPNGKYNIDYTDAHVEILKSIGFSGAVSTNWGSAAVGNDIYQLPRISSWDKSPEKFLYRVLKSYWQ